MSEPGSEASPESLSRLATTQARKTSASRKRAGLGRLDPPFDHITVPSEGAFSWERLFSHREDLPRIRGDGRSVCVIGGGIAGLTAAYELARRGFVVTVVESEGRCGGRIHTHYFPDGTYGELGAMRLPLVHSATLDYVERFDLPTRTFVNSNAAGRYRLGDASGLISEQGSSPQRVLLERVVNPLLRSMTDEDKWGLFTTTSTRKLVEKLERTSLRDYATSDEVGLSEDDWSFVAHATGLAYLENGVMAQFLVDLVPTLTATMVEIVGGMELLPQAFLRRLDVTTVIVDAVVNKVSIRPTDVAVSWVRHGLAYEQSFDFAVLAIPPLALKGVHIGGAEPTEQRKKWDAIHQTSVDCLAKTLLHCSERFWERLTPPIYGGTSFTSLGIQQCWYPSDNARRYRDEGGNDAYGPRNPEVTNHRGVFTASYRWGDNASAFGRLADAERTRVVKDEVAALHGLSREEIDRVVIDIVHKFWQNGFSYFRSQEHERCHNELGAPLRSPGCPPRVFFAGEHLGVIHGWIISAILPALKAVKDILTTVERGQLSG